MLLKTLVVLIIIMVIWEIAEHSQMLRSINLLKDAALTQFDVTKDMIIRIDKLEMRVNDLQNHLSI